jgi:hypothetical protein
MIGAGSQMEARVIELGDGEEGGEEWIQSRKDVFRGLHLISSLLLNMRINSPLQPADRPARRAEWRV